LLHIKGNPSHNRAFSIILVDIFCAQDHIGRWPRVLGMDGGRWKKTFNFIPTRLMLLP
jgi:hypothetical protein